MKNTNSYFDYLPTASNFDGIEKLEKPKNWGSDVELVECPLCKGHGGWNLKLNTYGEGEHFRGGCNQCNGWGWVIKGSPNEYCIHEVKELGQKECLERGIQHFGMCYHVTECIKCRVIGGYDSSG